jgi:hypothetical protein
VIPALYARFGKWLVPKPTRLDLEASLASNETPQSTVLDQTVLDKP